MSAYYNEIDPYAAQWLRNLISAGHIAPGDVDERSIEDVKPDDIRNYTQCHFFAGIGVWSYALRNAGWPDDRPVWTGSCPCQPFSAAGKGGGFDDERHLWPHFYHLIEQCKPSTVFGEQVASKTVEPWIDLVQTDLETMDYAFGCVPFPSASVGAPHIRDRAYWVANTNDERLERWDRVPERATELPVRASGLACTALEINGFWRDADWLYCRDEKWRAVEPGTFPLANGITSRMGRTRAYGNAINAEAAKEFILAYIDARNEMLSMPA
jgi:DNA (cytosine-5)-methyltransferase 1